MTADLQDAAWQFNEAVSLLREAHAYIPEFTGCAEDIDAGLPAMQAALEALAAEVSAP